MNVSQLTDEGLDAVSIRLDETPIDTHPGILGNDVVEVIADRLIPGNGG